MRAMLASTEGGTVKSEVTVQLRANEAPLPAVRITPDTSDVYRLVSLRPQVRKGKNVVTLSRTGEGDLAYQIVAVHHMPWTASPEKQEEAMSIGVKYDATTVKQDAMLGVHVDVRWNRPFAAAMTLVDLGIPPGFELVSEDLEKLVEKKQIERYSNTGRQLIVYLTAVTQEKPVALDYRLRARYPVRVKTPASRAYPYYQPEAGAKAEPVELTIQ
jgi:alpha-2-macroglobulin-like protein